VSIFFSIYLYSSVEEEINKSINQHKCKPPLKLLSKFIYEDLFCVLHWLVHSAFFLRYTYLEDLKKPIN
jgi:hypothetical protein